MLLALLASTLTAPASAQISTADQVWAFVDYGKSIGESGILVYDGPAGPELVVSASRHPGGYVPDYWYVLTRRSDRSPCEFVSESEENYVRVAQGDVLGTGSPQWVFLHLSAQVTCYDPVSRAKLAAFSLPITSPLDMALGDSDHDGRDEIHVTTTYQVDVFDGSGQLEWSVQPSGASRLFVAQMDLDPGLEITIRSGHVWDGITRQLEWQWPASTPVLGFAVDDFDGDGRCEIAVAEQSLQLNLYDVDLQALQWSRNIASFQALAAGDLDADGSAEILLGEGPGGSLVGLDGGSGIEICRVTNPGTGFGGITAADVDQDGEVELIWGSEFGQTSDRLLIADWRTQTVEWQSDSFEGPFIGPRIGDLTGDGIPEVVAATYGGYGLNGRILVFDEKDLDLLAVSDPVTAGPIPDGLYDLELGDLDGDGRLEILVATGENREGILLAYRYSAGTLTPIWSNASRPTSSTFMHVEVADLDGDLQAEVIGGSGHVYPGGDRAAVYVYDAVSGLQKWRSPPLAGALEYLAGMEVRDLDLDGHLEIAAFARWNVVQIYDPVTRQLEGQISGLFSFMTSFDLAGVPTLLLGDDFGGLHFHQEVNGAYPLVRSEFVGTTRFQLIQPGPRGLAWVGSDQLRLLDLGTRQVHWTAPNHRFNGSAIIHPPHSEIEFLCVGDYAMVGFRGR